MAVSRRDAKTEAKAVGELAIKVWDTLLDSYRARLGAMTVTDLMRSTEMGRSEILFWLRELAEGGWVEQSLGEHFGQMVESWCFVARDYRHAELRAAE